MDMVEVPALDHPNVDEGASKFVRYPLKGALALSAAAASDFLVHELRLIFSQVERALKCYADGEVQSCCADSD